jgi:hypothetical protein
MHPEKSKIGITKAIIAFLRKCDVTGWPTGEVHRERLFRELFHSFYCLSNRKEGKMNKKLCVKNLWFVMAMSLIVAISATNAFASGGRRGDGRHHGGGRSHGREVVIVGHDRYHYQHGRFYRPGWFGFNISVVTPPFGAVVTFLPAGHRTIIVKGASYYYYDNVYYTSCPSGYIVVPAPSVSIVTPVPPQPLSGETVTINVPNSNGSFTPVTLVKKNDGYIGPQGEYYAGHPTLEQLKALYGQ